MTSPTGHAARRGPRERASGHATGRGLAVAALVVLVVAGIAVIDRVAPPPAPAPAGSVLSAAAAVHPTSAQTSSWYCTGGTTGTGGAGNTLIYVTNTGKHALAGTVTTTVNTGKASTSSRQEVSVPAGGITALNPGTNAAAGNSASTLTFAGGGVAVTQIASGPAGWSTAPCASATSADWYLAGGATTAGNQLSLALYNPTSTDAVANVSFFTNDGVVTPQPYQGLLVPAGHMVVEDVGAYVQNRSVISTAVQSQSGQIVADQLQVATAAQQTGLSLSLGAPSVQPRWYFGQTTDPSGSGASVSFILSNPTSSAETATVAFGLAQARVVPIKVPVPAKSVVPFTTSTANRIPDQTPYSVSIAATGGPGLVVARAVLAPNGAATPTYGAMLGTATMSQHWLVPPPGVAAAPGVQGAAVASLAVANPGPTAARVTVSSLGGPPAPTKVLAIRPRSLVVLTDPPVGGLVTLDVRSSTPVVVEEDSVPSGTPGVAASAGVPFG